MRLTSTARKGLRYGLAAIAAVATVGALAMPAQAATSTTASIKWSQPYTADDIFHGGGYNWSKQFCVNNLPMMYSCPSVNISTSARQANFHVYGAAFSAREAGFALNATSNKFTVPGNYKAGKRFILKVPVQMSGSWTCNSYGGVAQASVASNVTLYNDKDQAVATDTYSVQQDCGAKTKIGGSLGLSKDGPGASVDTDNLLPTSSGSFNSKMTAGIDNGSSSAWASNSVFLHAGKPAYIKISYFIWGLAGGGVGADMNLKKITWTGTPGTGSIKVY